MSGERERERAVAGDRGTRRAGGEIERVGGLNGRGSSGVWHHGGLEYYRTRTWGWIQHSIFAAVINVAFTRFKADKGITGALVHLRKKRGAGGSNCRRVNPRDAALGHTLC